ncbi:phosphonate ABC transporter, permease protein PhnE [Ancylobacter defluvii]|uniref:Membrane channel protein component of Pn transporter n=1 Tax=Ancylobacter defluvii TaxID=1282440 RepID=A0A9W6NBR3_9HYPH|nr:phosphonate ABC transporter, permease protein PhnE [Ancylobacter defluvii]MBS7589374.1 phosphonate ABC transporter, permease protein PhnE [Ancylobacter defluvii]GLK84988.1 membrane channel protein component of Pn transporter [Ancylobacter defluvii]
MFATETAHRSVAAALPAPPVTPLATRLTRLCLGAVAVVMLVFFWHEAEMNPAQLVQDAGNMATLGADFLRPDFTDWDVYATAMIETLAIAVWGTLLAVIVGIPFGILCADNVVPRWVAFPVRRLMDACRAINELVFALIFIAAVGLGPFAGVLALFVHTTGVVAKLFSEAVEAIDPAPVEGIRGTGGTWFQEIIYGVLPQVLPLWISYTLYRFESNVRSATVLGIVGGGGIGMVFNETMRGFLYSQGAAILIIVIVTVSCLDIASQNIRKRFI